MYDIRTKILDIRQAEMARIAGVTQATVSRWEKGEFEPNRQALARIRAEIIARGVEWDDRWFFTDAPALQQEPAQ
jgi:transcriptional regulator with XRE-family HTH domain